MAKPNYAFEKRQRELAKKKKKEEKEELKKQRKVEPGAHLESGEGDANAELPQQGASDPEPA